MILKWNRPNLMMIPTRLKSGGYIRLTPGANELEDDVWDRIVTHPMIQVFLAKDDLEVVESEKEGSGLSGYRPKGAKKLISETYSIDLLDQWKATETRKDVLAAIETQMEKMTAPEPKKESAEQSTADFL